MDTKVQSLIAEIEALSEAERQTLANEVLPLLLSTRAGLEEIDRSLAARSYEELDTVIDRARQRADPLDVSPGGFSFEEMAACADFQRWIAFSEADYYARLEEIIDPRDTRPLTDSGALAYENEAIRLGVTTRGMRP